MKMRNGANSAWISLYELDGTFLASDISLAAGSAAAPSLFFTGDTNTGLFSPGADTVALATAGSNRLHITSGGLVGIGTNCPVGSLHSVAAATNAALTLTTPSTGNTRLVHLSGGNSFSYGVVGIVAGNGTTTGDVYGLGSSSNPTGSFSPTLVWTTQNDQNLPGNVGIGTTSPGSLLDLRSASAPSLHISETGFTPDYRGYSIDLSRAQQTGGINFTASSPSAFLDLYAGGSASALGGWSGQIRFFTGGTNAYGTERMRITNGGIVLVGTASLFSITSSIDTGSQLGNDGYILAYTSSQTAAYFGRQTSDGTIVEFRQDGSQEGSISVSGTTVSYNGAHLSRWSQLPGGATREEILRGTVLSNIDEMCGWGEEENEQLNRMKVSDVEGDKNVSGVFQCWDDDDDTYTDDFYCAMTGDFIIRIAEGVTVERGDLLMSAGDGTAKPQDDDIIRSKTIAKITSTHVTCTYEDGSYCVPCVLMAC
jgi:hypothetical protein